ncbi:hypothetical protein F2Q70_00021798 [Brassica cretica]|uniref:Uncharacterized protein n=1 Tax=Brassica cretica TaxID=69181 RepID=A0A8S9GLL3_BRACR|nr:hypothetical protein F2Q70_00021798 [Brassica cretica]KAF2558760.1 hypothetical protein F2Q68_00015519 [Brassica cretica]
MKRQSIVGSKVMSIDLELVSSVDVLRKRLLGSEFDVSVDQHTIVDPRANSYSSGLFLYLT